jgi:threonine/homoserine/homoserine lactone efflux protein
MAESIITLSIVGFLAGIIFSMPIAGPISILVTTNALKGRTGYCRMVCLGAGLPTFIYSFFAVFGLTRLYPYYKPAMPYIILIGSFVIIFIGIRIIRTKFILTNVEYMVKAEEKMERKVRGGIYTGCLVNLLNPTLFLGWLTSTFWVITFAASLGMNTGGLSLSINQSFKEIKSLQTNLYEEPSSETVFNSKAVLTSETGEEPAPGDDNTKHFHLIISLFYGFFIATGSTVWFYFLTWLINRFRMTINSKVLSVSIKTMGIALLGTGLYFGYLGTRILLFKLHAG